MTPPAAGTRTHDGLESPGWTPQRTTAARNQAKILAAARSLVKARDAASLDMRDVARAAGVGVGTLYRRFGDKAGLLEAIISEDERDLQEAVLRGAPPLGPGAPAAQRLDAFLDALVTLTERNLGVLLITDATPQGRFRIGAYEAWRLHLVTLLGEVRPDVGGADRGWYADLLLAALDPQLYSYQRTERGLSKRRIASNLRTTAQALANAGSE
jgi:AcrR family transcriptional regulator